MMEVEWVDAWTHNHDVRRFEMEVSNCGLMLLTTEPRMLNEKREVHVLRQLDKLPFQVYALCGDFFFPYFESIVGFNHIEQLEVDSMCEKCSIEAEYLFYVSSKENVGV